MSADAKDLDRTSDGEVPQRGLSQIDEELRFHLDMTVERLVAEGLDRAEAEAEARRRFGDPEAIALECAVQQAGRLGILLQAWAASANSIWKCLALIVVGLAIGDPIAGLLLLMLVSLETGAFALLAASPGWGRMFVRPGQNNLLCMVLMALANFLISQGDWVHSVWSVQYPLCGLVFGAGLMLIRVWPEDRQQEPTKKAWSGAVVTLLVLVALGALPFLFMLLPFHTREDLAYDRGFPFVALWELASFHGPPSWHGHEPRIVSVTKATTWLAAVAWTLFALLALIGRAIRSSAARRCFYLVVPVLLQLVLFPAISSRPLSRGIWSHGPLFPTAYGPVLLAAVVAALALFGAVRRAESRISGLD